MTTRLHLRGNAHARRKQFRAIKRLYSKSYLGAKTTVERGYGLRSSLIQLGVSPELGTHAIIKTPEPQINYESE